MNVTDVFLIVVRFLHSIAAVSWVGGSIFYLLVLRPASQKEVSAWSTLNQGVAKEFKGLVDTCILVLVVTGTIMTFDRLTSGIIGVPYAVVLAAKVLLALWMFYMVLTKRRRINQERPAEASSASKPIWFKAARIVYGYNLIVVLGILVFLLADLLRFLVEKGLAGG